MDIKNEILHSNQLNRDMSVSVYGHYGLSVLYFPAETDSSNEPLESGLISKLEHLIKIGKCKIFCISGIDREIWFGGTAEPKEKSHLHFKYNQFIEDDVIPYIYNQCGGPLPIITAGAAKGAYHAANTYFRRPDIFLGTIALSGFYDLSAYTGEYFDDNCYFNSPTHYLPNLNDNYWLSFLHSRRHIYLASGSGDGENPDATKRLSEILDTKGIRHYLEIRGNESCHNYESWNEMFKFFMEKRL